MNFEREQITKKVWRNIGIFASFIAIFASFYHIYAAFFGTPPSMIHRPLHLAGSMILIFCIFDIKGKKYDSARNLAASFRTILVIICIIIIFSLLIMNAKYLLDRFLYVTPLKLWEFLSGLILIILVLEATRRAIGYQLALLAFLFLIYGYLGAFIPGKLGHAGLTVSEIVEVSTLSMDGLWGPSLSATANYIFLFTVFGVFLVQSKLSDLFNSIATKLTRGSIGGPAKASVVSSCLVGMITGASTVNVMTTGTFTIPNMKASGFPPYYAAGVEAAASAGSQIMPPVMGVAAFIMAELTGIPYIKIITAAIAPALLYYWSLLLSVHFEGGLRNIISGQTTKSKDVEFSLWELLVQRGYLLIPLFLLVYWLFIYTPQRTSLYAIIAIIIISTLKKATRMSFKNIISVLETGAKTIAPISLACACAGLIVGMVSITGLGLKLTQLVILLSHGELFIALFLSMITAIILGMGLPTSGAYIVMATLLVPAIVKMGVPVLNAHFFVFYYACFSTITPPVCLSSFAAAAIADANINRTAFAGMKLALLGLIIPFLFVYDSSYFLMGNFTNIVQVLITATIGIIGIAIGFTGWLYGNINIIFRLLMLASGILLLSSNTILDVIGIVMFFGLFLIHFFGGGEKKKKKFKFRFHMC